MDKLPTAEEFAKGVAHHLEIPKFAEVLRTFAKLHVQACKEDIAEDYTYYLKGDEGSEVLDKEKFYKEAYPLTNIK